MRRSHETPSKPGIVPEFECLANSSQPPKGCRLRGMFTGARVHSHPVVNLMHPSCFYGCYVGVVVGLWCSLLPAPRVIEEVVPEPKPRYEAVVKRFGFGFPYVSWGF
jgi:hypothetical protein